jgi:predicted ATPase/DNA-binding CsgD family transcriptional regulator
MDAALWQEIRDRRTAGAPIKTIARDLGIARNTVRRALASDAPPGRSPRRSTGSIVDRFEPLILEELAADPEISVSEIASRIGWTRSATVLKDRVRALRPIATRAEDAEPPPRHGLPPELTSFVGREPEVADVLAALRSGRLVTLTGPGGVGKTRLAARAAADVAAWFGHGVNMVELAALREERLLAQTVVDGLGLADRGVTLDPARTLAEHVREQEMLLVLDNCEHLREVAADLVTLLLGEAPHLRVLTTSRQALGVPGERVVVVPPLPLPGDDPDSEAATTSAALELFRDRASSVVPDFRLTDRNRADVVALCRQLDGLPLAIELAAARLRVLSLRDLVDRLEGHLGLLADRGRTTDERHRTIEATMAWSFELCSEPEQALWSRASVFAGSFDLDAAVGVCADEALAADAVLDHVAALVDKSILMAEESEGHVRFRMLETVRQFGLTQLTPDQVRTQRTQHCQWYAALTERLAQEWFGPDQLEWRVRMRRDHANLRAALEFGVSEPGCGNLTLRLLGIPWFLWAVPFSLIEHRHWLDRVLAATEPNSPDRPPALATAGMVPALQGEHGVARRRLDEADRLLEREPDPVWAAFTQHVRGMCTFFAGDLDLALELLRSAGEQYATTKPPADMRAALAVHLGLLHRMRGELDAAEAALTSTYDECIAQGELWFRSYVLDTRGFVALARNDVPAAARWAEEALRLNEGFDDTIGLGLGLDLLAWTAASDGDSERAAILLGAASEMWRSVGRQLYGSADWQARRQEYERRARLDLGAPAYDMAHRHGTGLTRSEVLRYALDRIRPARLPATASVLSARELEVARLVARGQSNREIAETLVLSPRTVEGHVGRILTKLGFASRIELAVWVERHGR